MFKRRFFLFALLVTAAVAPVRADDLSNRVDQMQDQIRQLTGQIEQLSFQIKQMQTQRKQAAADVPAPPAVDAPAAAQPAKRLKPTAPTQEASNGAAIGQGVEAIGEAVSPPQGQIIGNQNVSGMSPVSAQQGTNDQATLAPAQGPLSTVKSAKPGDGGFQGKMLVQPNGTAAAGTAPVAGQQVAVAQPASAPVAETPDDLFQRNYQAFMQLRYPEAEAGFKEFIAKYPDHGMAGSADFWLGEAYWAEQNFGAAAQAYQDSYHRNPKGRRAPDSLLKLGMALSRLGQKEQACIVMASVDTEYPNAVDVKKRAQAAYKREGCG